MEPLQRPRHWFGMPAPTSPVLDCLNAELTDRTVLLNDAPMRDGARYVLVWLQQTLRGHDNPVIDAGVAVGNRLGLPVLVHHGLREDYPHASDRLHRFILGASRAMGRTLRERGIACVQQVVRPETQEQARGLVYRLAENAACVVCDRHATFVGRWQAERFAAKADLAVAAVDGTRLVPHALLPSKGLGATKAFRAAHGAQRAQCLAERREIAPEVAPYEGALPFTPDALADRDDAALDALMAQCRIDHTLPPSDEHPATKDAADARVQRAIETVLPRYKWARNNPADEVGASQLSPYLHFGMVSPFEILRGLDDAGIKASVRYKFVDELLTWREWGHWRMTEKPSLMQYDSLPGAARKTMEAHADDPRDIQSLDALIHGETPDETWNAAQKQWLTTGWMHNNLRMYWSKQLLRWTASPQAAWATACYLERSPVARWTRPGDLCFDALLLRRGTPCLSGKRDIRDDHAQIRQCHSQTARRGGMAGRYGAARGAAYRGAAGR